MIHAEIKIWDDKDEEGLVEEHRIHARTAEKLLKKLKEHSVLWTKDEAI